MADGNPVICGVLLAFEDGNVFFYAALILIAFISWVVGRIREAVETFKERQRTDSRRRMQGQGQGQRGGGVHAPQEDEQKESVASRALRETYRALGIPFPGDEPAEPSPPPVPSKPKRQRSPDANASATSRPPALTKAASAALRPGQRQATRRGVQPSAGAATLRKLLSNRSAIRQAILLKEVLDPPKGLREDLG